MANLPYLDAEAIAAVDWPTAVGAIASAVTGLDPRRLPARTVIPIARGELMLMTAEDEAAAGVKVLTIAPGNPARGLPRIQAVYVLFDAQTLTPRALLDGAALTTLRTPAVSAFAADTLAVADASTMTVFGSGPQAEAHVHAMRSIRPIRSVFVVGREVGRAQPLITRLADAGIEAQVGTAASVGVADIVVCATTAREPLFDGAKLGDQACVIAVGSHEADVRELDDAVFRRSARVVVEDAATARREAGDVILAIASGALRDADLIGLAELNQVATRTGISVFKSVGAGWQDLAVAEAAVRLALG